MGANVLEVSMNYLLIIFVGLLGGVASGLFGVGGGVIFVPLLVLMMNFDIHLAIGTSLAVIIPTSVIGGLKHMRAGMIDWKAAALIVLFAALGAWWGATLSLKLDTDVSRKLFAVFLFFLSLKLFFLN